MTDDFFMPMRWPTWVRRVFILTLPISGLAYLLMIMSSVVLVAIMVFAIIPIYEMWTGQKLENF